MQTSVYLSADAVQVVRGTVRGKGVRISSCARAPLPEGAMINGVVTNDAALADVLSSLAESGSLPDKDVDLVVDSGSILVKRIAVPPLRRRQMLHLIHGEFIEYSDTYEDLLYDYSVISRRNPEGPGGIILCSAMERRMAQNYTELFERCGIRLQSIDISLSTVVHLAQYLPALAGKTFVISVLDGSSLVSSLFAEGHYALTNRTRLLAERGTPEAAMEVTNMISSMIQFNRAQQRDTALSAIYLCGLGEADGALCDMISSALNAPVAPLPDFPEIQADCNGYHLGALLYPTGNLLRKGGGRRG